MRLEGFLCGDNKTVKEHKLTIFLCVACYLTYTRLSSQHFGAATGRHEKGLTRKISTHKASKKTNNQNADNAQDHTRSRLGAARRSEKMSFRVEFKAKQFWQQVDQLLNL